MVKPLTKEQRQLLDENKKQLSVETFLTIATEQIPVQELALDQLVEFLELANLLYRQGQPLLSDASYDFIFHAELARRNPEHPFLKKVEPEGGQAKTVALPVRMLSTDKAYDLEAMERWAGRVKKAAEGLGLDFSSLVFRVRPKLDGYAAYDDGSRLYTRGDGRRGTDISRAFRRGLQIAKGGDRGLGAGEVVVSREYFASHLAEDFDNSRNFQASLLKEKELDEPAAKAMELGKAVFYPFSLLPSWQGGWEELLAIFPTLSARLLEGLDYDTDGLVFEVLGEELRAVMGATRHHHRWQIAYKENTQTAEVLVEAVIAQTSRSGRVNPVAEVEATRLSGATIRRATAHHFAMVKELGIGPGAVITLSRSGEVIPKIENVVKPASPYLPKTCPSCGEKLVWDGDYLLCPNALGCPAQLTNSLEHFFKILGNIDGFGPASISRIYKGGIQTLSAIYALTKEDFTRLGFGPKQAENMVAELRRSRMEAIEDWRFLAAFGVRRLGMGNAEKLLASYELLQLFTLTNEDIVAVAGFSDTMAREILSGLGKIKDEFFALYQLGYNLLPTPRQTDLDDFARPLLGKTLVFTGTMESGSRKQMESKAKALGAKTAASISGKTDYLVYGAKLGRAKQERAEQLGVAMLSEEQYLKMIES